MKKLVKKLSVYTASMTIAVLPVMTTVMAKPKLNEQESKNLINEWLDPISSIALWAIPSLALVVSGLHGIGWMTKEEDEKEQKPLKKTLKKIGFYAVLLELLPAIYKIVNL